MATRIQFNTVDPSRLDQLAEKMGATTRTEALRRLINWGNALWDKPVHYTDPSDGVEVRVVL